VILLLLIIHCRGKVQAACIGAVVPVLSLAFVSTSVCLISTAEAISFEVLEFSVFVEAVIYILEEYSVLLRFTFLVGLLTAFLCGALALWVYSLIGDETQ